MGFKVFKRIRSWWESRKERKLRKKQESGDKKAEEVHRDETFDVQESTKSEDEAKIIEVPQCKDNPVSKIFEDTSVDNRIYAIPRMYRSDPQLFSGTLVTGIPKLILVTRYKRKNCRFRVIAENNPVDERLCHANRTHKEWVQFEDWPRRFPDSVVPRIPPPPAFKRRRGKETRTLGNTCVEKMGVKLEKRTELSENSKIKSKMKEACGEADISADDLGEEALTDHIHGCSSENSCDHPGEKQNTGTDVDSEGNVINPVERSEDLAAGANIMKGSIIEAPLDSCGTVVNSANCPETIEFLSQVDGSYLPFDECKNNGISTSHTEEIYPRFLANLTDEDRRLMEDLTPETTLDGCNTTDIDGVSKCGTDELNSIGTLVNDSSVK